MVFNNKRDEVDKISKNEQKVHILQNKKKEIKFKV